MHFGPLLLPGAIITLDKKMMTRKHCFLKWFGFNNNHILFQIRRLLCHENRRRLGYRRILQRHIPSKSRCVEKHFFSFCSITFFFERIFFWFFGWDKLFWKAEEYGLLFNLYTVQSYQVKKFWNSNIGRFSEKWQKVEKLFWKVPLTF